MQDAMEQDDMGVEIERFSEEPCVRPVARRLDRALEKFRAFSVDFMANGRGDNLETERSAP